MHLCNHLLSVSITCVLFWSLFLPVLASPVLVCLDTIARPMFYYFSTTLTSHHFFSVEPAQRHLVTIYYIVTLRCIAQCHFLSNLRTTIASICRAIEAISNRTKTMLSLQLLPFSLSLTFNEIWLSNSVICWKFASKGKKWLPNRNESKHHSLW